MKNDRDDVAQLQKGIQELIDQSDLAATLVMAAVAEFMMHYGITTMGIDFTERALSIAQDRLQSVRKYIELFPENGN